METVMKSNYIDNDGDQGMMKGVWSSTAKQLPLVLQNQSAHPSSQRRMLNVMNNAVDEALCTILAADDDDDDDDDGRTVRPAISSSNSSLVLNPIPIHPLGIQDVTEQVPLTATWEDLLKDPNTDLIKWVFTTSHNVVEARTIREEEEEEDYEPLDAFSSTGVADSDSSTGPVTTGSPSHVAHSSKQCEKWEECLQELLQYRDTFGNCLVPHNWKGSRSLAQWVKRQRYQYKLWCKKQHSTLTKERIEILNKVGFVWNSHNAVWEDKFNELKVFLNQNGHCNVPSRYSENKQLSIWVRSQRRQYKLMCQQEQQEQQCGRGNQSYMTRDRLEKLQSLGFVFDPCQKKG